MNTNGGLNTFRERLESMEVYLQRVTVFRGDGVRNDAAYRGRLRDSWKSYDITAIRHSYVKGLYAVMVIRDLIFLTYTDRWANGS
jgi:hypothetical protein